MLNDAHQPYIASDEPFSFEIDTTQLEAGENTLRVTAQMNNGRTRKVVEVNFDVRNGDPGNIGEPKEGEQLPNQPPSIQLAASKDGELGQAFVLEAGIFDDGRPTGTISVMWSKSTGPEGVKISNPNAAKTTVTFSVAGNYVFLLAVDDGDLTAEASIEVHMREPGVSGGPEPSDDPEPPLDPDPEPEPPTPPTQPDEPSDPRNGSFDRPIRITEGGVYTGRWESSDPNVPVIFVDTSEPVIIENSVLKGSSHLIATSFHETTNLTVRNTYGFGENPNVYGRHPGRFVHVETFANLVVENNYLEGTSGIYIHRWMGGGTVKVRYNQARNIVGLWSDGAGSWLQGSGHHNFVQFTQFNNVNGISDAEIAWNEVVNVAGKSRVEDVISLYNSSGTSQSAIRVHDNFIMGAYPALPDSQSFSGGGIMLGDGGGSNQIAYRNQVVSVANYGIAISGGSGNRIEDNRVVSAGMLQDGTRIHAANVGIYVWNQYDSYFGDNVGIGNIVGYVQVKSNNSHVRNDWWVPDVSSWSGNSKLSGAVDLAIEEQEYSLWKEKRAQASVEVGAASMGTLAMN